MEATNTANGGSVKIGALPVSDCNYYHRLAERKANATLILASVNSTLIIFCLVFLAVILINLINTSHELTSNRGYYQSYFGQQFRETQQMIHDAVDKDSELSPAEKEAVSDRLEYHHNRMLADIEKLINGR